ncbi:protein NRDE2 homolog isoform X2 [Limulus polyphemus]|uniref:Protein NRDE2 homolog isoform X2 n=1 Tax=Limulus polyphemus TaxID=6850 RepID=A0ABM1T412_LIMPO|nr:protein NRDE2 homolog isoform X2 [Limulus polyphemus]
MFTCIIVKHQQKMNSKQGTTVDTRFSSATEDESETELEVESTVSAGSLFPAYCGNVPRAKNESAGSSHQFEWLQNKSFPGRSTTDLAKLVEEESEENLTEEKENPEGTEDYFITTEGKEFSKEGKIARSKKSLKKEKKNKHKHKKYKTKSKSFKPSISDDEDYETKESIYSQMSKMVFIEETGLAPERAFHVDSKHDRNNLAFSSLYHQHIARYYEEVRHPLGSNIILWPPDKERKKKKKDKLRYYSKKYALLLQDVENVLDLSVQSLQKSVALKDYVPLSLSVNEQGFSKLNSINSKEYNCFNPLGVYDSSTVLYLQGKGKESEVGSSSSLKPTEKQWLYQKTEEFNKYLTEHPGDEQKWLDFIDFQDIAAAAMFENHTLSSTELEKSKRKNQNLMVTEKKLAILESALKSNPCSIRLAVSRLELGQNIWEIEKLLQEWKQLIFHNPNSSYLCQRYITFVQTQLSYFTVSKTVKVYSHCLMTLNKILEGIFVSHTAPEDLEENMLDIFYHFCSFLHQCGQTERAVASFQALVEFNMYTPKSLTLKASLSDWIVLFEPFWDSGSPRFGEEGALGWATVITEKNIGSNFAYNPDLNKNEDEILNRCLSKSETWLHFENLREGHYWLPWRPGSGSANNDETCEDPERMVLVDDVSNVLFRLKSESTKFYLVLLFLQFLGVRTHNHSHIACSRSLCLCPTLVHNTPIEQQYSFHSSFIFLCNKQTFQPFKQFLVHNTDQFETFITRIFEQSLQIFSHDLQIELLISWFQYTIDSLFYISKQVDSKIYKQKCKLARKKAKNFLKKEVNRNNLTLWEWYGKLEWACNNRKEAEKIFETSFEASLNGEISSQQRTLWSLTRTYIELELGLNNILYSRKSYIRDESDEALKKKILWVLLCLGGSTKYSAFSEKTFEVVTPVRILKAQNAFKTILEEVLQHVCLIQDTQSNFSSILSFEQPWKQVVDIASCFAFFQYFTHGLAAAASVFESLFTQLVKNESIQSELLKENLYEVYINLIAYDSQRPLVPLKSLRSHLTEALTAFPSNSQFLAGLVNMETNSLVTGRLRRFFNDILKFPDKTSPIIWMFAVYAEHKRHEKISKEIESACNDKNISGSVVPSVPDCGVTWRIRSLFERALDESPSRHCVGLWRWYLKFEVERQNYQRAEVIFYRALQQCPWAKDLYVDGIAYFPNKLEEIHDIMIEKEIRVRTPPEEIEMLQEHHGKSGKHEDEQQTEENM